MKCTIYAGSRWIVHGKPKIAARLKTAPRSHVIVTSYNRLMNSELQHIYDPNEALCGARKTA